MIRVLCKLRGSGTDGDSYRANFPNYRLHSLHIESMLAIIEIPDADAPSGLPVPPFNAQWVNDGPVNAVRLVGNNADALTRHIQKRYREGFSGWSARKERGD